MVENVFVVGLNDHSAAILSRLPDADRYRFHRLLSSEELLFRDTMPLPDLLAEAQRRVEAFDGPVHAVIGSGTSRSAPWWRCCVNVTHWHPNCPLDPVRRLLQIRWELGGLGLMWRLVPLAFKGRASARC